MHLAKLNELGITKFRKEGKRVIYSIKNEKVYEIFKALRI